MIVKLFFLTIFMVGANSRYLTRGDFLTPRLYSDGNSFVLINHLDDVLVEQPHEPVYPEHLTGLRIRRDAHGTVTVKSDGTSGVVLKSPIAGNDRNQLSAIGALNLDKNFKVGATTAGLALDNVNGHGLTLTRTEIPGFGAQNTGAGKLKLFHNDNHDLSANAFITNNIREHPMIPNYNTIGGGVDYMYKDKVGASLGASHTNFFDRNDYSAMGKLNLYKDHDTSVDLSAGFSKFDSPSFSRSWEPNSLFSITRNF